MNGRGAAPLTASEFAALVAPHGPFGPASRVAAAVSGGADSMALLLAAAAWAGPAGVRLAALTVDHGLRPESAGEAARVAAWCAARGVEHHVLAWSGPKPSTGLQEAARAARYRLLTGWCRAAGFVHLMVAHHLDDQAETFLMRLARGAGAAGLAAMPAVAVRGGVRVVRPLLAVPRARLTATLEAAGETWIEDPANRDRRFARVRLRETAARLAAAGIGAEDTGRATTALGAARARRDRETAALAARAAAIFPEGYAEIDAAAFAAGARDVRLPLLAALLRTVGGAAYAPRGRRLQRLAESLDGGPPARRRTLGGCLVEPAARGFRICREPRAVRDRRPLEDGAVAGWDRRFDVTVSGDCPAAVVAPLGDRGWQEIAGAADRRPPPAVRTGLPALWIGGRVAGVPFGVYGGGAAAISARFRPAVPLCGPPFGLA